ncbi:MAG: hypothetical protein AAF614_36900, partial [Chloroflexota bacterium]
AGVIFANMQGEILTQDVAGVDLASPTDLAKQLQAIMTHSFALADDIGSKSLFTLQYHTLDNLKIYSANVGRNYFLVLFFTTVSQVGGISMVSVFTQRAIKGLLTLLNDSEANQTLMETSELVGLDSETKMVDEPVQVEAESPPAPEAEPLSEEELAQLLALDFSAAPEDVDLNAFWSETETSEGGGEKGLSLEEAMKQGIITADLGADED